MAQAGDDLALDELRTDFDLDLVLLTTVRRIEGNDRGRTPRSIVELVSTD